MCTHSGRTVGALCAALVLFCFSTYLAGCNEQLSACLDHAEDVGRTQVVKTSCNDGLLSNGELVLIQCDLQKEGLVGNVTDALRGSDFTATSEIVSTGLKVEVEMKQCSETYQDGTGWQYDFGWRSDHVDSSRFNGKSEHQSGWQTKCGIENPPWPTMLPQTRYVSEAKAGSFTIDSAYIKSIPLTARGTGVTFAPGSEWNTTGCDRFDFCTSKYAPKVQNNPNNLGEVRINFHVLNWSNPAVTVMGHNIAGHIRKWSLPSTWLCSSRKFGSLKPGKTDMDSFFKPSAAEGLLRIAIGRMQSVWVPRILAFGSAWLAFCLILSLYHGNAFAVGGSCCLASAWIFLIAGIVWITTNPLIGVACTLVGMVLLGAVVYKHVEKHALPQVTQSGLDARQVQLVDSQHLSVSSV